MKKSISLSLFFILLTLCKFSFSQDVGVTNILSPNPGCDLEYPQTVTIEITNFSNLNINIPFDLSYKLNNLPVVRQNENLTLGSGSTISFTFAVPIELGLVYGPNTLVSSATNSLDLNNQNDTLKEIFDNFKETVGGMVDNGNSFCDSVNSGIVTLSNHKGNVQFWQSSTNFGASWTQQPFVDTFLYYNNLPKTTLLRAAIKNGSCPLVYSEPATIEIVQRPAKPIVSYNGPVCEGGQLKLTALSDDNVSFAWFGPNGFQSSSGIPILNNIAPNQSGNYKVYAYDGSCLSDTSELTVSIEEETIGGTTTGADFVCASNNEGEVGLTGQLGSVVHWEFSENGGTDWVLLSDSSITKKYKNIPSSRSFRALVKNGTCASRHSAPAIVAVSVTDQNCAGGTPEEEFNSIEKIANLLTPNGDGMNDTWLIQRNEPKVDLHVKIYNRSGVEVFRSDNYNNEWGGESSGGQLQDGTYYYVLGVANSSNTLKGVINLIR